MTNGTSQGLFIVVAIVIFGLFVVLSNNLFGDELSPALVDMFTTSAEQSTNVLDSNNNGKEDNEDVVQIKDNALKDSIIDELANKGVTVEDSNVTVGDMKELDSLTADGKNIKDLAGLEVAENLKNLDVHNNDISSIIPIKDLENLIYLNIKENPLPKEDIEFLKNRGIVNLIVDEAATIPDEEIEDKNVESKRQEGIYLYAKIRDSNDSKGESEIWVKAEKVADDKKLKLVGTSSVDGNYESKGYGLTGLLDIPNTIDGIPITEISANIFDASVFEGTLVLPSKLEVIGESAFENSLFTGDLELPSNVQHVSSWAFYLSRFDGKLTLPNSLKVIEASAFAYSEFTGELVLPEQLEYLGDWSLTSAEFTGELILPESITYIGNEAFEFAKFSGELILPSKLGNVGNKAFYHAGFTKLTKENSKVVIGNNAFYTSKLE